ncbi:MAG: MBL fold metallo-hydrolase [Kiritimatiellae bacterium]|nr:MBL fold metallo-hydrolase [Kiritimatiellia bacterium]
MRIQFHGAARTTTGSMHLLDVNGSRILLDCGLYQGKRKEAFERNRHLPFDPGMVDLCLLSHAHIDHSGNLPTLVKRGFAGPVFATPATCDLCEIMLLDSAHLQVKDVEYVNRKRAAQGQRLFEPLYEEPDVRATLKRMRPLPYDTPREVADGVRVTYHDAGHILGSALMVLTLRENGAVRRLLFTGDMGRKHMPILRDPTVIGRVDCLLTESTYGDRLHPPGEDVKAKLAELVGKVAERGSRLVIPAFSVGRTQQVLYFLHQLWKEKRIRDVPVYVDSPLSTKATAVYDRHPECYDRELLDLLRNRQDPFGAGRVTYVTDVADSKRLNEMRGPVIILSASGMCEAGRILHHLKHSVDDARNVILIVGFQAEHTLGRRLVEHLSPIRIFGERHELRAEVHSVQALSAHADRDELLAYFRAMGTPVPRAFVVHGEPPAAEAMGAALREMGVADVTVPASGDVAEW